MTVAVGADVRNLGQLKAGDQVRVKYRESLTVAMAKPGRSEPLAVSSAISRSGPGEKPARTVEVTDPHMQAFIRTLKAGDVVNIAYTRALAIAVSAAPK